MGGVQSADSTVKSTQDTVNDTVINNIMTCGGNTGVESIDITGSYNNVSDIAMTMTNDMTDNCFFSADNQQSLQNDLVANLTAQAQASGSMLGGLVNGGLYTKSEVDVSAIQDMVNSVSVNNTQTCFGQSGYQGITIDGNFNSVSGIVDTMSLHDTLNCMFSASNHTNIANQADLIIKAAASTGKASKTIGGWVVYAIVAFIVIGMLYALFKVVMSGSAAKPAVGASTAKSSSIFDQAAEVAA